MWLFNQHIGTEDSGCQVGSQQSQHGLDQCGRDGGLAEVPQATSM